MQPNVETLQTELQYAIGLMERSDLDAATKRDLTNLVRRYSELLADLFGNEPLRADQLNQAQLVLTHLHDALDGR